MSAAPIKICGITRPEDAHVAEKAGAGAIGINLYARSSRYVPRDQVRGLLAQVGEISKVAILVHPSADELRAALELDFDAVQIHAPNVRTLAAPLVASGRPVIATAGIRTAENVATARQAVEEWRSAGVPVLALLVDAKVSGSFGGTGQTAPWELLQGHNFGAPLILAGGLTPENVVQAIRLVRPHGVDVASGVERLAGVKDPQRLRDFVAAARSALVGLHASKRPGAAVTSPHHNPSLSPK